MRSWSKLAKQHRSQLRVPSLFKSELNTVTMQQGRRWRLLAMWLTLPQVFAWQHARPANLRQAIGERSQTLIACTTLPQHSFLKLDGVFG